MDAANTGELSGYLIRAGLLSAQFERLRRLETSSASQGFVAELARLFLDDSADRIRRMEALASAAGSDVGELGRVANQLLGSSDTFGAVWVAASCRALVLCLVDGFEAGEVWELLRRIKSEVRRLRPLLQLYGALDGREEAWPPSSNRWVLATCTDCSPPSP